MPNSQLDKNLHRAINFCSKNVALLQKTDGGFKAESSQNKIFNKTIKRQCAFFDYLILNSLSKVETFDPIIKRKLAQHIIKQKGAQWTFNFWDKLSEDTKSYPYPDDLDDTFCALSALYNYDSKLITGEAFSSLLKVLAKQESKIGGPYKTWLVDGNWPEIWQDDIDVAVNSNIAYFLKLNEASLPNLDQFIAEKIDKDELISPLYYYSKWPIYYFTSRCCPKNSKQTLINQIESSFRAEHTDLLQEILGCSALLNLGLSGPKLDQKINKIALDINKSDLLPHPFVIERVRNKRTYYLGSSALTLSFALELFSKYSAIAEESRQITKRELLTRSIKNQSLKTFDQNCRNKQERAVFRNFFDKITSSSLEKLTLLAPSAFAKTVLEKPINFDFLVQISVAHLYGWISYTIYDDFLDSEGDPQMLSIANICHRLFVQIFQDSVPNQDFLLIMRKILNEADEFNFAEISRRNLPLGNKVTPLSFSQKSMGHSISSVAILFKYHLTDEKKLKSTLKFYRYSLALRQLCDDMHDWEEDLKKGERNFVTTSILHDLGDKVKEKSPLELRRYYWVDLVPKLLRNTGALIKQARKHASDLNTSKNNPLLDYVDDMEKVFSQTKSERKKMLDFLKNYN